MSSHHTVREKQEPALIIANGESCDLEILHQLLEWNPFVLVLDGAWDRVRHLGIKVDAVLGDGDSLQNWNAEDLSTGEMLFISAPDQNKNDLEKGLEYLIERGEKAVHIVWATGKRADHFYHNISILPKYQHQITASIIDNHSRIYCLPKEFKKWYKASTILSLIPIHKCEGIKTKNLAYNLEDETLEFPIRSGSSNQVTNDGFVEITYQNGNLVLMECWDSMD